MTEKKPPTAEKQMAEFTAETNKKATGILKASKSLTVTNPEERKVAESSLLQVRHIRKNVEKQRQFHVKPLNEQVKKTNAMYKTVSVPLDEAEGVIKNKIKDYDIAESDKRKQQEAEIEKDLARGATNKAAAKQVALAQQDMQAEDTRINYRDNWVFEIEDFSKVPKEFKVTVLNDAKVKDAIKGAEKEALQSGKFKIKGLKIWNDRIPVTR